MKSKIISSVRLTVSGHEHKKIIMVSNKIGLVLLIFCLSTAAIAQNLNGYRYALVPSKFSFQKEKDKYQLNTLSKLFMQKYGFETYFDSDAAPFEFSNVNCNKVYFNLLENNSLFFTRLKIVLSDCTGKVLFVSKEGSSKEKVLKVAYNEALRQAFISFEALHHKYDEKITVIKQPEITSVKEILQEPKAVVQESKEVTSSTTIKASDRLYAQAIENGFQLVDASPKVVMKLYRTSVTDVFTAVKGSLQGVLVSKNNEWFFEYYQNDKLVSEKVDVKF